MTVPCLDRRLCDPVALGEAAAHEAVPHARPGLLGVRSPLEPDAQAEAGVVDIARDVDPVLTNESRVRVMTSANRISPHLPHPEQLGGASVHLEEGGTGGLGPGHVALAPPASEHREHVL